MSNDQPPLKPPKKIWFGSDFHFERYGNLYEATVDRDDIPEDAPFDYMLLAGDITHSRHVAGLLEALYKRSKVPILFTPGNHEFWDGRKRSMDFHEQLAEMQSGCDDVEGVTFLYNQGFDIPDTNSSIFMSPWFTNLAGYDDVDEDLNPIPQSEIQDRIGDYHRTYMGSRLLTAEDHILLNKIAVEALELWLEKDVVSKGRTPIIATHFGPSARSAHARFPYRDLVAAYFNTDYLDTTSRTWPSGTTWIHGHTHHNVDYQHPAGLRVVTNQFGYKGESDTNDSYDFMKHIEVY